MSIIERYGALNSSILLYLKMLSAATVIGTVRVN